MNEIEHRQWLIEKIEGYTGSLKSVPYQQISTTDLESILEALEEK